MSDQSQILLQTKLHRPRLPKNLVVRTRLLELLNNAVDRQLTLVCAPAGFGKSTLISTWLNHMEFGQSDKSLTLSSAWLSLDENDFDLNLFLRYFIAAVRTIFNNACGATLELLQSWQQPSLSVIYTTFINELDELPGEFILVLDDYHFIRGEAVPNLLMELTRHWPESLHLILISRVNPPLPIENLRAKGVLSEIRSRNLRFTREETLEYLRQFRIVFQSQNAAKILEERFEGWPAGLHLVALTLQSDINQDAILSELPIDQSNITKYLITEVLDQQLPVIHSFLLKTSILDRFCAPLCEAILGEHDSAWSVRACLDWIERSELFVIPLDDRREWFRYHHLFQELVQQRLANEMSPEQIANMHHQASIWFEERNLLEEAMRHALAAGDPQLANHQMTIGMRDVINREDWPTLVRWLRLLPEEMIQRDPWLLMIRVWILELTWRLEQQAKVIAQVEKLVNSDIGASMPEDDLKILRGQILMIRSQQLFFYNQTTQVIDMSRESLALLPPAWTFVRGAAMLYLGLAMHSNGQAIEAERMLLDEYGSSSDKTDIYPLVKLAIPGLYIPVDRSA